MRKFGTNLLLFVFWGFGFAWSQNASLSLETVLAQVRQNHPTIHAANASIRAIEAEKDGLSARFLQFPEVDASVMQVLGGRLYNVTIGGMQTFELRNQLGSRVALGDAKVRAAREQARLAIQNKVGEVRLAFVQAMYAQEKQTLLTSFSAEAKALQEALQARFQGGQNAGYDVTLATIEANRAEVAVRQARLLSEKARQTLALVANMEIGLRTILVADFPIGEFPALEVLVQTALQNRMELAQLVADHEILSAERVLADKNRTPNLQAGAFLALDNTYLNRSTPVVGLRVAMPLPIRRAGWYSNGQAEINRLTAEMERSEVVYEAQKSTIRREVQTAYEQFHLAVKSLELAKDMERLLGESSEQIETMYQEKRLDVVQYLAHKAKQGLVRLDVLELTYQVVQAQTELENIIGLSTR